MVDFREVLNIIIRSFTSITVLFLITKVIGRKQISQLSFFDYVIGISIGSIASQMTCDLEIRAGYLVLAMLIYGGVGLGISVLTLKNVKARRFFDGDPIILIEEGKIISNNLKKAKYDVKNLLEECRANGFFNINDIKFAIIETSGKLSILSYEKNRPLTVKDMGVLHEKEGLVANIIISGKLIADNLNLIGKDKKWLMGKLKEKSINNINEVLLATYDVNGNFNIFKNDEKVKNKNCLE